MLPAFLTGACMFVCCLTVLVAHRREIVSIPISNAGPLAQDSREEDRKFLDDLVRKQNQDGNLLSAPVQTIGEAGTVDSSPKEVRRAELVINNEIVRRGELVVHSGKVERKRQSIAQ